jgi:hypothetical protein
VSEPQDITGESPRPRKPARPRDPSLPPRITRGGDKRGRKRQPLSESRPFSGMQTMRAPDYLVIGQIVCDIQPDGTGVLGGTALYSGLTAARLGARVGILTRGRYGETIDGVEVPSLEAYSDQVTIITQEADSPTFFVNEYLGTRRTQQIRRWAGPIDLRGLPPHWANAKIIHLGPVAREIDAHQALSLTPGFLGMTPQGWMREWPMERGGRVRHVQLRLPPELLARTDAVVVSDEEIVQARAVVQAVGQHRLGVVTLGPNGCQLTYAGKKAELPGYPVKTSLPPRSSCVLPTGASRRSPLVASQTWLLRSACAASDQTRSRRWRRSRSGTRSGRPKAGRQVPGTSLQPPDPSP